MAERFTEEAIDSTLKNMDACVAKVAEGQGKLVKLRFAEADLLQCFEVARDFMMSLLQSTDPGRTCLLKLFGGDCVRVARVRACVESVQFSDMYASDQRRPQCMDACESVEKVLQDLGWGRTLRTAQEEAKKKFGKIRRFEPSAPLEEVPTPMKQACRGEVTMAVVEPIGKAATKAGAVDASVTVAEATRKTATKAGAAEALATVMEPSPNPTKQAAAAGVATAAVEPAPKPMKKDGAAEAMLTVVEAVLAEKRGAEGTIVTGAPEATFVCGLDAEGTCRVYKQRGTDSNRIVLRGTHDECRQWQVDFRTAKRLFLKGQVPNVSQHVKIEALKVVEIDKAADTFACGLDSEGTCYVYKHRANDSNRVVFRGTHDACRQWQVDFRTAKRLLRKGQEPEVGQDVKTEAIKVVKAETSSAAPAI